MEFRLEKDTMGEVSVPADKYWGAQTERSRNNFKIGWELMPLDIIHAFAQLKKAAAHANHELGQLPFEKMEAITHICDEIISGKLNDHFPLKVWQTGSGTQSNMNVNEVIAFRGNQWLADKVENITLHPNDDVNMSQSSNDTYPTALHVASYTAVFKYLIPEIEALKELLYQKADAFKAIVKIGRTHLQDATPLTLGQEISGWAYMLEKSQELLYESSSKLLSLAIGGTAVGTGINAHIDFGNKTAKYLSEQTGYDFYSSPNKFHALTSHDEITYAHGAIKALAADAMKIANDVRWLASGPRSGIGEITIPENEPGSSIMPGKVNPTQSEALTMITAQVFGNDVTIGFAASQGNFELNVFKPVIAYNFLQSVQLLTDGLRSFRENCMIGLEANENKIKENVESSLMLVTALNPHIGYEKAAQIAKLAFKQNGTLKEAALSLGFLTEDQFDQWIDPKKMVTQ